MDSLSTLRQFYARLVTAKSGVSDKRIAKAFEVIRREDYLPPGPWQVLVPDGDIVAEGYIETPNNDPAQLYQDILVALDGGKGINSGAPALHARCLNAVLPQAGDTALHIGCGTGYYTALLATLVGSDGQVEAIEVVADLAKQAERNLSAFPNVAVICRSGADAPLPKSDIVYVNAGATEPRTAWLDALEPGGRLIFPLTPGWGYGGMLLVTRPDAGVGFDARFISRAAFIPCLGAQTENLLTSLAAAFAEGDWQAVRSLRIGDSSPDETCWFAGSGWWLSTARR